MTIDAPALTRLRLGVAYDGTGFSGWSEQPGRRTVQGEIEAALQTLFRRLGDVPTVTVAGRTDAGVQARGQVVHLDLTDAQAIGKLAVAVAGRWDELGILVLNAAMLGSLSPVQDIDPKEYSKLLSLNLLANQAMIAAFDGLLRKAAKADVVALTSSVGAAIAGS